MEATTPTDEHSVPHADTERPVDSSRTDEPLSPSRIVASASETSGPAPAKETLQDGSTRDVPSKSENDPTDGAGNVGTLEGDSKMDIYGELAGRPPEVTIKSSPAEDTWPDRSGWEQNAESEPFSPQDPTPVNERPLNVGDALFYLDSVKKQFSDSPGVYNRFLDIMKDFKNQTIDTPGVIQRVSTLFAGYPQLIEGFNTFLPAGYRIECSVDAHDTNIITVTTPGGTTTQTQSSEAAVLDPIPGPSATAVLIGEGLQYTHEQISPAMEYVAKIRQRFAGREELYHEFIDILNSYKRSPVDQEQLAQRIADLFQNSPDLLSGLQHFVPREMFNALGSTILEKDVRGNKHVQKKASDSASVSNTAQGVQKRKRKAPVREKEKEKERERDQEVEPPARATQTKAKRMKYQQDMSHEPLPIVSATRSPHHPPNRPVPPPPSHHGPSPYDDHPSPIMNIPSQSDMHFFERVRLAIDNREVYNEFLKLVNLFTQDIIDMRRLVERSRTFLGEELLTEFKEIIGWDSSWESVGPGPGSGGNGSANASGEGLERLTKEHLSIRNGPSYRRLPASEATVPCSGRDEMCKSVLNDEWVTHPTWASEDSGFYTHKKNAYEEALHRSEEERHEYDFHIEAITRTIATLEPFHMKIMQLSPEERATSKQKMPLSGVNKAIHQRIIKKIYGREAGLEVLQAMHDSPAIAIPIVFSRLKQKEEEWKTAQREWNKVWREIDARNYQKSLDHQGITFKTSDKKAITAKTFLNQIESAREEQMSKRASLVDPLFARTRPRYHMAFAMEDTDVMLDLFKLTFSLLDRMQHHISATDRRRIEGFLRSFVPLFFMFDPISSDSAFRSRHQQVDQQYFLTDDFSNFIDETDETTSTTSTSRSGRNGRRVNGSDLRKKLLKTNAQDKSRRAVHNTQSTSNSRLASPAPASLGLIDDPLSVELSEAITHLPQTAIVRWQQTRRGAFFTNATFYTLLRLIELLYTRLSSFKELTDKLANDPSSPYRVNPLASDLGLLSTEPPDRRLAELQKRASPAAQFYPFLLETCERLFDNTIDQQTFEDIARHMFGTKAYLAFTIDKVIGAIIKQVQNIISDSKSLVILDGLKREREMANPSNLDLDDIRGIAEKAVSPEENLFRIDWAPDSHMLTIQLLGKDDASFDDVDVYTGRWQAYIDSFVSDETTKGLTDATVKPPFLTRNYRLVKKTPLTSPSITRSGLEIKICVRTYRMFFVSETEDFMWKAWSAQELEDTAKRTNNSNLKRRNWLKRFDTEGTIPQ